MFMLLGLGALAFFGWAVMALWNAVLVPAAGAHLITFWQGLGLLVLSRILVGGFGGRRGRHRRGCKEKWDNMTPEEREQLKNAWKQRWGGGEKQPAPEESTQ